MPLEPLLLFINVQQRMSESAALGGFKSGVVRSLKHVQKVFGPAVLGLPVLRPCFRLGAGADGCSILVGIEFDIGCEWPCFRLGAGAGGNNGFGIQLHLGTMAGMRTNEGTSRFKCTHDHSGKKTNHIENNSE